MKYLSPSDIAKVLGIHRRDVYRILHDLPRLRVGRRIRVTEADLSEYLKRHTEQPWGDSSDGPKRARGGAIGPTQPASEHSGVSGPLTGPLPESDSETPSWLRPLRRRAADGKG